MTECRACLQTPHGLPPMLHTAAISLEKFLEKHGGKLPHDVARTVLQQLAVVVVFCHKLGKVNRDLQLSSILVFTNPAFPLVPLIKVCGCGGG